MLTFRRRKREDRETSLFGGLFGFFGGSGAMKKKPKYKHSQAIGRFNLLRFNVRDDTDNSGG